MNREDALFASACGLAVVLAVLVFAALAAFTTMTHFGRGISKPWPPSDDLRLSSIFYPYASKRRAEMVRRGGRFVHYTNADAAMSIIRNGEIWMRLSSCMSDFSEVEHGLKCLYGAYRREDCGGEFKRALEDIAPGLADEIGSLFDAWTPSFRFATYLTCISEHDDNEDRTGRLSTWRAYSGGDTGVAFVMRPSVFLMPSDALRAYTSPVAYLNDGLFAVGLLTIANNIDEEREFLRQQDRDVIKAHALGFLQFAVLCTKHPGFAEEKEWRIVYSPDLEKSNHIANEIVSIRGTPQLIYKIPLKDFPDEGLTGASIVGLIERVIIGPTTYPVAMHNSFVELLKSAGIRDAHDKVYVSDIPLRR